jgi:small membrane protein
MLVLVQPVLVLIFLAFLIIYLRRFRTRLLDRALIILFFLFGVLMIIFPEISSLIARRFGVGRGADFVMYFGLTSLIFACLILYSKLRDVERQLTKLVSRTAIENVHEPLAEETTK